MSDVTNTPPAPRPSRAAFQDSTDGSISSNSGTIAQGGSAQVHDRTGLYLAVIAVMFSAMAFGAAIIIPSVYEARMQNLSDRVQVAEREMRVAQERYNDIKVELTRRGIPVSDH